MPIFKLFDFTLNTVQTTDESGQVLTVGEEQVRFPLPVAARVIGLKGKHDSLPEDEEESGDETTTQVDDYGFAGFDVEFSNKVFLTPVTP